MEYQEPLDIIEIAGASGHGTAPAPEDKMSRGPSEAFGFLGSQPTG